MDVVERPADQLTELRSGKLNVVFDLFVETDEARAGYREIHLSRAQPAGLILGAQGAGKSVLSLHLAGQALKQGAPRVCVALPAGKVQRGTIRGHSLDLAPVLFRDLRSRYGYRIEARPVERMDDLQRVFGGLPPGSLLIADEVTDARQSPQAARDWISSCQTEQKFLLISSRRIEDVFDLDDPRSNQACFMRIAAAFSGSTQRGYAVRAGAPKLAEIALRSSAALAYPPRGKREFVLAALGLAGGGLVHVPRYSFESLARRPPE